LGAGEQEVALAALRVREARGRICWASAEATEFEEQIAAHRGQQVVGLEGARGKRVDELEAGGWAEAMATATARLSSQWEMARFG